MKQGGTGETVLQTRVFGLQINGSKVKKKNYKMVKSMIELCER